MSLVVLVWSDVEQSAVVAAWAHIVALVAEVAIDATYVLKGLARLRRGETPKTNADLW